MLSERKSSTFFSLKCGCNDLKSVSVSMPSSSTNANKPSAAVPTALMSSADMQN
ncbi:hypothetical protein QJS04_geneDACA006012 [Acorus gramineus]|uniref:Uncharacterized protein n=1 Tax=Acorus gramineus TaxID=55184 RepID=A0AAV9B3X3_ACOGR|nr:hypothetical protein QJS04_geneDACA006012 [Acorus gramineus]